MKQHNLAKLLIQVLLSGLAAVLALLCATGTFGWFFLSRQVGGNGTGVQLKDCPPLEIRATATGADISVDEIVDGTLSLTEGEAMEGLSPGTSGSFTFYVHDGSEERLAPYAFWYDVSVCNDPFHPGDRGLYQDGFYPGLTEKEKELSLTYVNSHLLFFTARTEQGYSGWIRPDEVVRCTAPPDAENKGYGVTVYWVWLKQYGDVFGATGDGLIAEETRAEIQSYYSAPGNRAKMLDGGEMSQEAYNIADTMIGMSLKYIYFRIEVAKE